MGLGKFILEAVWHLRECARMLRALMPDIYRALNLIHEYNPPHKWKNPLIRTYGYRLVVKSEVEELLQSLILVKDFLCHRSSKKKEKVSTS